MSKPTIFISHKHSDTEVATVVADFIKKSTAGKVRIHLSSNPDYEGPRTGRALNDELRSALAKTELVILIYTTDAEDWSFCMWECGVAVDPNDEQPTSVVVIQTGDDAPVAFGNDKRVDARNPDSVKGFVKELLTTTTHFPDRDEPLTDFAAEGKDIARIASDLHSQFESLKAKGGKESVPASPYLRLLLDDDAVIGLKDAADSEEQQKIIADGARITDSYAARDLLGLSLHDQPTLGDVLEAWHEDDDAGKDPVWFEALAEQLVSALAGKIRPMKWAPYRVIQGRSDVPFVAAKSIVDTGVEFDVHLVPIAPRPVLLRQRMLAISDMYHKNAAEVALDQITLVAIKDEMSERGKKRLPILNGEGPITVVHQSTIDAFLADRALKGKSFDGVTLANLLDHFADNLEDWFVILDQDETLEVANDELQAKPMCEDVFVTEEGKLVGWLTNVMVTQT